MYLSNSISVTTKLVLNGITLASGRALGRLHLQEDDNRFCLYVPRDERLRELSYLTDIPEKMVAHFRIKDRGAAKVFGDILRSSLLILDDVLTSHGIVRVPEVSAESAPESEKSPSRMNPTTQNPRADWDVRAISPSSTAIEEHTRFPALDCASSTSDFQTAPLAQQTGYNSVRLFATDKVSLTSTGATTDKYRALLDHVIQSAQSNGFRMEVPDEAFVPDDLFGVRSANQLLQDMKIWCCGRTIRKEPLKAFHNKIDQVVQAFEFLLGLVPFLSRSNWRSTIRKYVCVHEKYSDMASYDGAETADTVHEDLGSVLTEYLIKRKYLDKETWKGKTPNTSSRVKTTTQACDARFSMSKAQVKRVSD